MTAIILFPVFLLCIEWLRSWLFGGHPFLSPAFYFIDSPLVMLAPLGGQLLMVFIFGIVCSIFVIYLFYNMLFLPTLFFVLATVMLCIFLPELKNTNSSLSVAIASGDSELGDKYSLANTKFNIENFLIMFRQRDDLDAVFLPETTISVNYFSLKYWIDNKIQLWKIKPVVFAGGFIDVNEKHYSAYIPLNQRQSYYIKQKLIPFGEFTPQIFARIFPNDVFPESDISTSRTHRTLRVKGIPFSTLICYEAMFSDFTARQARDNGFLVNPNDLSWFSQSQRFIHRYLQILRLRALENQKPLLVTSNKGISAFINAKGEIEQSIRNGRAFIEKRFFPKSGASPFSRWGNRVVFTIMLFYLVLMGFYYLKYRRGFLTPALKVEA